MHPLAFDKYFTMHHELQLACKYNLTAMMPKAVKKKKKLLLFALLFPGCNYNAFFGQHFVLCAIPMSVIVLVSGPSSFPCLWA